MPPSLHTDANTAAQLDFFYTKDPARLPTIVSKMTQDLKDNGNHKGNGPLLFLVALQTRLQVAYGLAPLPAAATASRPFHGATHLLCYGDRQTPTEVPKTVPIIATDLFATRNCTIADFAHAAAADPTTFDQRPFAPPNGAAPVAALPILPLIGPTVCQLVIDSLYDPTNSWRPKDLVRHLAPYIDTVTDPAIKTAMQNTLMALATKDAQRRQASLLVSPPNLTAPLKTWLIDHANAVLNPTPAFVEPTPASPTPPATTSPPAAATPPTDTEPPPNLDRVTAANTLRNSATLYSARPPFKRHQPFHPGDPRNPHQQRHPWGFQPVHDPNSPGPHPTFTPNQHWTPTTPRPVGLDALPNHRKLLLLTLCRTTVPRNVPERTRQFLDQSSPDACGWFMEHVWPKMVNWDPEAFSRFHFSAKAIDCMHKVCFTDPDPTCPWHGGLVGHCLLRPRTELRECHDLLDTARSPTLQLQINPNQVSRLHLKPPPLPTTAHGIYAVCCRIQHTCCVLFSNYTELGQHAKDAADWLIDKGHLVALEQDHQWRRNKIPEFLQLLVNLERDQMSHHISNFDIQAYEEHGDTPPWFKHHDSIGWLTAIRTWSPTIGPLQFDPGLQPKQLPTGRGSDNQVPPAAHTPTPPAPRRQSSATSRPNPRTPARNQANSTNNGHVNTHHHPHLAALWNNQEGSRPPATLGQILQAANSSVPQLCTTLGLDVDNDCARFHIHG